jgi:CDP-2,3-bis-(O-geranylgeranyl)-sn-glycerol synthase
MKELFFVLWFFAPAGLANLAAFFSSKIPYIKKLNYPVDFKLTFRKRRILGSHKTIRGFVVGIIFAILAAYLQIYLFEQLPFIRKLLPIDYAAIDPIIFGFLSGFGALAGDALKSFFKRQVGITPGKSWVPFDQTDYILGGMLCTWFYFPLTFVEYILLFVVWSLVHPLFTLGGFLLKLRKQPV